MHPSPLIATVRIIVLDNESGLACYAVHSTLPNMGFSHCSSAVLGK